jgi:hypothetical protein
MYKQIFFLISLVGFCQFAHAQFNVGDKLIGGELQLGFTSYTYQSGVTNNDDKNSFGGLQISFAKAKKENAVTGFGLAFNYNNTTNSNDNKTTNLGFGIGVFKRKYLALGKQFFVFGETAIGYLYGSGETKVNSVKISTNTSHRIAFSFSPGLAFSISKKWLASARFNDLLSIGYSNQKSETTALPTQKNTSEQLFINSSSTIGSFFFGVNYVF